MRSETVPRMAVAIVLTASTFAIARGMGEPSRIDQVLARWEEQASGLKTLEVRFSRQDRSKAWGPSEEYDGTLLVKGAETAAIDFMRRGEPPAHVERIVWAGTEARQFDARSKQIFLYPATQGSPFKLPDAVCLPFLHGRKVAELKEHYDVRLENEDTASYVIRFDAKAVARPIEPPKGNFFARLVWAPYSFQTARVLLDKETLLPRVLHLVLPDGKDTQTYRVTSIRLNEPIRDDIFQVRAVKGWKVMSSLMRGD